MRRQHQFSRFGPNNGNNIENERERVANRNGYRVFLRDALLADCLINRSVGSRQAEPPFHLPTVSIHFDTE